MICRENGTLALTDVVSVHPLRYSICLAVKRIPVGVTIATVRCSADFGTGANGVGVKDGLSTCPPLTVLRNTPGQSSFFLDQHYFRAARKADEGHCAWWWWWFLPESTHSDNLKLVLYLHFMRSYVTLYTGSQTLLCSYIG